MQHIVQFAAQVILYASAIFYSPGIMPPQSWYWMILEWNPFLHTVDLARNALLWGLPVNLRGTALHLSGRRGGLRLRLWFFRKMQPAFADVI